MKFWKKMFGLKESTKAGFAIAAKESAQPSGASKIHDAAKIGDLGRIKILLKCDPGLVFSKDNAGRTPLHVAVDQGHKDLAELLLTYRADVNAKDNEGMTPLYCAASLGHTDMAKLLLANNAEVDAKIELLVTLLHGRTNLAQFLQLGPEKGLITIIGSHK